jgi:hypothetical protein
MHVISCNVYKLEKDIFNGLVCRRLLIFDRIYRISGISFLSPFPDERVKEKSACGRGGPCPGTTPVRGFSRANVKT